MIFENCMRNVSVSNDLDRTIIIGQLFFRYDI